ncbi:molybdopterin cofactor-binding domain-containing protein [Pelagicoccus sp. SDUM812003]|uniref:xanthine dehydrogenase family protein molybdopterin-binding subunit n=1 Tax=Pelagicoccus sp. SDUM812003 TaxID=3041267 RepID=UPI00281047D7|nr:molybdopterin cofactor-binding domain-containing protein [Pelagicoccus sp. SDUM812003]MDQ8204489.1 molybdopterin-dependent oxidoreductase [Pelagicoccus sp. SDUM812003]
MKQTVSRRHFLKLGAAAGGGLLVKAYWTPVSFANEATIINSNSPWFWAEFLADGSVSLKLSKQEMGQGVHTGLAMLFAEEACLDWSKVSASQANWDRGSRAYYESPFGVVTGGSSTIHTLWEPMRLAGAQVRDCFVRAAARKWKVDPQSCTAKNGYVLNQSSGESLSYHELSHKAKTFAPSESPELKPRERYELIGKSVSSRHNRAFVTGSANYASNVRLPGMLHAVVNRRPLLGSKLVSFDARETLNVPGVVDVVEISGDEESEGFVFGLAGGVAVLAESTWSAMQGARVLKVEWDMGENANASYDSVRSANERRDFIKSEVKNDFGDIETAFSTAVETVESSYENLLQAHGQMEPLTSTASFKNGNLEIWSSCQDMRGSVQYVARLLAIEEDAVTLHSALAGGSFGRLAWADYVGESALLSKMVGKPVKVTWTREDDMRCDYYHPQKISKWKGCLDSEGFVSGIWSEYGILGTPSYWWLLHWAYLPYGIDNVKVESNLIKQPIRTGAWRSVVEHMQAFPEESFIDELSYVAGEDPYRFRLKHVRRAVERFEGDDYWRQMGQRAKLVLESVPDFYDWDAPLGLGKGRGIAMSKFGSTIVCQIAEVDLGERDFTVERIVAIVAPGKVLNPQLAENQIEGGILWALSACKHGRLSFEHGKVKEDNYDAYPVLRFSETPELQVHFLEDEGPLGGMGELGVPATAPAVANAIYAISCKRLRSLPFDTNTLFGNV